MASSATVAYTGRVHEINNGSGTEPAAQLQAAYTTALTTLGRDAWLTTVPAAADDPLRRAYALSHLVVRAAGQHARTVETLLTATNPGTDLPAAPVGVALPGEDVHERALWEVRQVAALLAALDIGDQADPYIAAAAAATAAAETLVFTPMRRLDSLEEHLPAVAVEHTRAYLEHAQKKLRRALDAVDAAHTKLGPDTD